MPDTTISLGGFTFTSWAVPERVNGGGRQRLAIHRLIGGGRVIDAMGWDADQIKFAGRMRGDAAQVNVRLLETLARVGTPVVFSYWASRYQVFVSKFAWRFERYYEIVYDLTLEVLADLTQDAWLSTTASLDDLFGADFALVSNLAPTVPALASNLSDVGAAQASAGPLQSASLASLAPLVSTLQAASTTVLSLQTSLDAAMPVCAAGQVVAAGDPAQLAAALLMQLDDYQQQVAAVQAAAVLGRMQVNLATAGQ